MKLKVLALVALATSVVSSAANAAVVFNVSGTFNTGGTLTGTFTTNDAVTQVTGLNLISSANGSFQETIYSDLSTIDFQGLPNAFRLTITQSPVKQLQLAFTTPLTTAGAAFGGNSFEAQQIIGAGNRLLTGTAARAVAAVPEPATWAMMMVGFGMVGAASRYRRRGARVTYA